MSNKEVCISCFREKSGAVCKYCGYAETENRKSSLLPARTLLSGRYLIGEADGIDSLSVEYKALDTQESRIVEVQEYFPREYVSRAENSTELFANSDEHVRNFECNVEEIAINAGRAKAFSKSENVIRILDSFKDNNTVYIVKEYVEGMYLSDFLDSCDSPLDTETAVSLMASVLSGLAVIHKAGMFHGSISSQNIILTVNNEIKISDYGFLKNVSPYADEDKTVYYVPGFAPPENYRLNGIQSSCSDVYSAAAVLYSIIAGKKPSDALNRMNGEALVPLKELVPDLPDHVGESISKALNMEPAMRFRNAADFRSCLTKEKEIFEFENKPSSIRKHADKLLRKLRRRGGNQID